MWLCFARPSLTSTFSGWNRNHWFASSLHFLSWSYLGRKSLKTNITIMSCENNNLWISEIKWIYIIRCFQNFTEERKNHWGLILFNLSTFLTLTIWFQVCFFRLGIQMPPKKMFTALKAKRRPRFVKISPFWGKNELSHTIVSKWIYILCCSVHNI